MLLNLSNHPSLNWSEPQRQTAIKGYGDIQDMSFPSISPEADTDEVALLVERYYAEIRKLASEHVLTVHLMGELTFCFALVQKLQAAGISCVASTSERIAKEEADGHKVSLFSFVRFRAYISE